MSTSTANPVTAIAVGNFDGMHRGHAALFERLGDRGGIVVIEHYRATLTPGLYRALYAAHPLFFYDFDKIRGLTPEAFVAKLQKEFPSLEKIVVGEDFRFGAQRRGDIDTLEEFFDGEVVVVPELSWRGKAVHSRHIRDLIREGAMEAANGMLGHEYETWGEVVKGQGIGAKELVPTLNLDTGRFLLPSAGVYRSETCIDGVCRPSVTFVGHRLTTDGRFAVETHLIGIDLEKRSVQEASIRWLKKLRENRPFDSLESLKRQIQKDIADAEQR
ncbi:bifunctional riboflavin kinase/FAD synthetase [Hydrogenimonas sp.]